MARIVVRIGPDEVGGVRVLVTILGPLRGLLVEKLKRSGRMATVTRKTDLSKNRTTDEFVTGKKYHYWKGDPELDNVLVVQFPSGLAIKRPFNGTHPDAVEARRIESQADYDDGGIFTTTEQRDWNKAVLLAHLIQTDADTFLDDADVDTWTNARKEDGLAGIHRGFGIPWTNSKSMAPTHRTAKENLPGNERSANPGGNFSFAIGFYMDRSFSLTSSNELQQVSLHSNTVFSGFSLKILDRTAVGVYDVLASVDGLSHGGTGWENFEMPAFQTPATGTLHVGVWLPAATSLTRNLSTLRATSATEPTGTGFSLTEDTQRCPGVGVRFERDYPKPVDMGFGANDVPAKYRKIFEAVG